MKYQARQTCGSTTYQKQFGGAGRDFATLNSMPLMPMYGVYRVDGNGRDSYISMNNGGYFKGYHPDLQPQRGTIGFGERRLGRSAHKTTSQIEGKRVAYTSNGSGRDGYISRTNGGFYPEQTIAAYQKTYVNQLRNYERPTTAQSSSKSNQRKAMIILKDQLIRQQNQFQEIDEQINKTFQDQTQQSFDDPKTPKLQVKTLLQNKTVRNESPKFLLFSKSRPKTGWQQEAKTDMEERRREVWNKQVQKHKPGIIGKSVTINPDNYSDEINQSLIKLKIASPGPKIQGGVHDRLVDTLVMNYQVSLDARLSQPKRVASKFIGQNQSGQDYQIPSKNKE